jgi:hypothetical protein
MWYESCLNPQALRALYASGEGLDRVRLFTVVLRPDGRSVQLRVELPRFPDHPPERWDAEASRVQVTLDLWSVADLKIEGWTPESAGLLTLSPDGDALRLSFASEEVRITARCGAARIAGFSPYSVWESEPAA